MNLQFDKPIMVFRNQTKEGRTYYTTSISRKMENGEYDKAYMFIKFKGNPEIENQSLVMINKSFLTFNKKENKATFYIMALDYEFAMKKIEVREEPIEDVYAQFGNSITVEELDNQMELPF